MSAVIENGRIYAQPGERDAERLAEILDDIERRAWDVDAYIPEGDQIDVLQRLCAYLTTGRTDEARELVAWYQNVAAERKWSQE